MENYYPLPKTLGEGMEKVTGKMEGSWENSKSPSYPTLSHPTPVHNREYPGFHVVDPLSGKIGVHR